MKKISKFFLGLSCGLLLGFVFFNASTAVSSVSNNSVESVTTAPQNMHDLEPIELDVANNVVSAYSDNVIDVCENASTKGGFISKSSLQELCNEGGEAPIKYRFFYEAAKEGEEGSGTVGVLFYSSKNATQAYRVASGSYCPVLCDYD